MQASKIILASASSRRHAFLKEMNIPFQVRIREIDESYPEHLKSRQITEYIALEKAKALESTLAEGEILITSDTIVWHREKALGKPKDAEDAFLMLRSLTDATHEVITSVCFKTINKTEIVTEVTEVTFGKISDEHLRYYIDRYQPFDKAGAYGIQEWIGLIGIISIKGSYTNVVGLPTELVFNKLQEYI